MQDYETTIYIYSGMNVIYEEISTILCALIIVTGPVAVFCATVAIYSMIDTELTLNDLRTQIEDRGCLCAL